MNSFSKTLHLYLNSLTEVTDLLGQKIAFNLEPTKSTGDRFILQPISDPFMKYVMCDSEGGQALVQFDGYGKGRFKIHELQDALRRIVWSVRGDIGSGYNVWKTDITGVRAFGTKTDNLYRYMFEATFYWSFNS